MSTVNAQFDWTTSGLAQDRFVVVNQLAAASHAARPGTAPPPVPVRRYDPAVARGFAALEEPRELGLTRSRNRAIALASEEICLFGDDDQRYAPDACERVEEAFAQFPDADIVTFAERTPEGALRKRYPSRPRPHSLFSAGRVRTPEIAFRLSRVRKAGLRFDADFGLNSKFSHGEEMIFLADALRRNLKVWFVPRVISFHPDDTSVKWGGVDPSIMQSKGAMMGRVFGRAAPLAMLAFAARKTVQAKIGGVEAAPFRVRVKEMWRGWSDYRRSRAGHANGPAGRAPG